MKKIAIIVGGGKGTRMGEGIPKQFLMLRGRPLLFHTLDKFHGIADEIILVLPEDQFEYWNKLWISFNPGYNIILVTGGETRTKSVFNGLSVIREKSIVAIHDAVRPLVSQSLITKLFDEAVRFENAVPVVPLRDSIRHIKGSSSQSVDRSQYLVAQTPQCFDSEAITNAYKQYSDLEFSDDAGLFEYSGGTIHHVDGEIFNIKITFNHDLVVAEAFLNATIL